MSEQVEEVSAARTRDTRWRRAVRRRLGSPPWLARAAGTGLALVSLAFVGALATPVATRGQVALVTTPPSMRAALFLPWLVVVFTLGTVAGTVLAWRHRYWSLWARLHQTLLALLGAAFVWQLATLGLL